MLFRSIEVSRPQTHDLIKKILDELKVTITRVEVSSLQDDIFYGTLILEGESSKYKIDCRPSDAIAIAVRAHVPIMVADEVMREASIVPEELTADMEEEDELEEGEPSAGGRVPPDEERLSIFEDYLTGKGSEDDQEDEEDENSEEDEED